MGISEHRAAGAAGAVVRVAVISVSDTRTRDTDQGGALLESSTLAAGYSVVGRHLIPDEPETIRALVRALVAPGDGAAGGQAGAVAQEAGQLTPEVILVTGGTGVAPRDVTVDAIAPLFERRLDGFGELFRMLSFAEIGPAAMLSRATAGIIAGVAVFVMPGAPSAIQVALGRLILPELSHLVAELRRRPPEATRADGPRAEPHVPDHRTHGHHHHGPHQRHRP